jgi:site-specific recombinase XerD
MHFYQLLRDFLSDYLIRKRGFSEKTARAYRQTLNIQRSYMREIKGISFDRMSFDCFSRSAVYDFLMWLKEEKGNSIQTLNLRLSAVKSFLKYCGEEDITLMPQYLDVKSIHAFKGAQNPCVDYLTQEQLKLLFSLPDMSTKIGRRDRFFMIFTYETGARLQEVLDLKVSSIIRNETSVRIEIHGKGKKIRYVPLLGIAVDHLDSYLAGFHKDGQKNDYLFYTIHNSEKTQMTPGTADYMLKKYAMLACETDSTFPENLHCHILRHSIAMAMYKKGIPLSYIRDFLGHTSVETTAIYSYSDEETVTEALEAVDHIGTIGNTVIQKEWKGKEQYLLEYCGFS